MFSTAKCGHCGRSGTKIEMIEPRGSQYKQAAICCASCSSILGVTGYYDAGTMLKAQKNEIAALKQQLSQVDHNLRVLIDSMNRRG